MLSCDFFILGAIYKGYPRIMGEGGSVKSGKKTKTKKANYALQDVRIDPRCMWMKSVLNLS